MMTQGSYFAKLVRWGRGLSQVKQSPQVWLEWEISMDGTSGSWVEIQPTKRTMFWSLAGGAVPFTMERLDRLEFNGNFDDAMTFGVTATTGMEIICKHSVKPDGGTREEWDIPFAGNPQEDTAFDPATTRQLTAQWAQHKATQGRPAPSPPRGKPPAISPGKRAATTLKPDALAALKKHLWIAWTSYVDRLDENAQPPEKTEQQQRVALLEAYAEKPLANMTVEDCELLCNRIAEAMQIPF